MAYGSVEGLNNTGGFFGFCGPDRNNPNQTITGCYSFGNVTGTDNHVGGFVGSTSSTTMSQCCALGNVTGQGNYIGGFAGENHYGTNTDCYAWGNVRGADFVGGYLGFGGCSLVNVYSKGRVTASGENIGGLIGDNDFISEGGTVTSCYYGRETSGQSDAGKGTPASIWDLTHRATFTGWDFSNVWQIQEGTSYPYFVDGKTISRETLGRCPYCSFGCDSVNLNTGNFIFQQTDLIVPSLGPSLNFTRFYNSQDEYAGPQGKGWTNNLNIHLTLNQDNSISVVYQDGHVYTFAENNGAYTRPPGCFETLTTGPDNSYILTFKNQTKYTYNATGQLISIIDKNGDTLALAYTNGLLSSAVEPAGRSLTFTHNEDNLLSGVSDSAGRSVEYSYDGSGNLAAVKDVRDEIIQYQYDDHGLTTILDPDNITILHNDYDSCSRVISQTDGRGNVTGFSYDLNNRQTTVTDAVYKTTTVEYDEKYRNTKITHPGNITESFIYDNNNCRTDITDGRGNNTHYNYDTFGNLLDVTDPAGYKTVMTYDYEYYDSGNIKNDNNSNEAGPYTLNSAALTYDADNRLGTYNGQTVSYDAEGNMTQGPLAGAMVDFTFDARSRLTVAGDTSYTYDAGNKRISVSDGVHQTSYVVNPNASLSQVLIATDELNNKTYYVYGLGLIVQESAGGGYSSYHFDHLGSTVAITNETGSVTDRFQHTPYGELVYRSGNSATPFLFNGQYGVMADESDLYFMRARYYNPVAKRFLSPDTLIGNISNPQSQNRYIYCQGNPANYIDPTGYEYVIIWSYGMEEYQPRIHSKYNYQTGEWEYNWEEFTRENSFARAAYTRKRELLDAGIPESEIDIQRIDNKEDLQQTWEMFDNYENIDGMDVFSHGYPYGPKVAGGSGDFWHNLKNLKWSDSAEVVFHGCETAEYAQYFSLEQGVVTYGQEGKSSFSLDPVVKKSILLSNYQDRVYMYDSEIGDKIHGRYNLNGLGIRYPPIPYVID